MRRCGVSSNTVSQLKGREIWDMVASAAFSGAYLCVTNFELANRCASRLQKKNPGKDSMKSKILPPPAWMRFMNCDDNWRSLAQFGLSEANFNVAFATTQAALDEAETSSISVVILHTNAPNKNRS